MNKYWKTLVGRLMEFSLTHPQRLRIQGAIFLEDYISRSARKAFLGEAKVWEKIYIIKSQSKSL